MVLMEIWVSKQKHGAGEAGLAYFREGGWVIALPLSEIARISDLLS